MAPPLRGLGAKQVELAWKRLEDDFVTNVRMTQVPGARISGPLTANRWIETWLAVLMGTAGQLSIQATVRRQESMVQKPRLSQVDIRHPNILIMKAKLSKFLREDALFIFAF